MRQKLLLLALAVLAGCAGVPEQEPPLTVELYDMRAWPPLADQGPALEAPRAPAAASPQAGPRSAPPVQPVPVEIASVLPAKGPVAVDQPRLLAPEPPPVAAGKAEGPVASAPTASTAKPAPRQQPSSPAASPAAPQAKPAAAAAPPAATAPSGTTAPAAPPAAAARVREIYARQGDELQIGLEGRSFLFLGFPDSGPRNDGMSFKGKETKANKSTFTFKALALGDYDLEFLQQDNSTGRSVRETVRVHVVDDAAFAAVTSGRPGVAGGAAAQAAAAGAAGARGDYEHAEKLAALGAREAALEEFLKGYEDGNGWLNDRIATLYFAGGDVDAAEKYWARNIGLAGTPGEQGTLGMVRVALARDDQKGFMALLKPFLAIRELSIEEELIRATRLQQKSGVPGVGLDLAAEYARRFPTGRWRDESEWLAGQLLEAESPFRDLARAREVYRGLLATWPESSFAGRARERVRWIEEHFFTVR